MKRPMTTVLNQSPAEAAQLDALLERDGSPLSAPERRAEVIVGGAFLAAVAGLLLGFGGDGSILWVPTLSAVLLLAVAMNVRFDVGGGFTVPTQLAFVPLMFCVPPALLPVAVVAAIVLGRTPAVWRGTLRPSRLLLAVPNAWFAVGPALVLTAAAGAGARVDPSWALLAGAFAAQLVVDFLAFCAREALLRGASMREQLTESAWVYGVDAALTPVGFLAALAISEHALIVLGLVPLLALLGVFSRERRARMEGLQELNAAYRGTALVLGDVITADDGYTGEHSKDVVELAVEVGDRLGVDATQRRNVEFGALLHDIGKVVIPNAIINKPGKLEPHEWTIVKTHTIEGQRMLDRVGGFMHEVGGIVRSHHERWDGTGYPDAMPGPAIPIESRIIACCDAFNAMTTTRAYRNALPVEMALAELKRHAGTQFDPTVVAALLDVIDASTAETHISLAA
jgi:putative nucleotidyltransferase with HDIG domain